MTRIRWQAILGMVVLAFLASGCDAVTTILDILRRECAEFIRVSKFEDSNGICVTRSCSVREAIRLANACPGPQLIQIPAGTYSLEPSHDPGFLEITDSVELEGFGGVAEIVGQGLDIHGPGLEVRLSQLAIRDAPFRGITIDDETTNVRITDVLVEGSSGPGIGNDGNLVLIRTTIRNNGLNSSSTGGIDNGGIAWIQDSLIEGNQCTDYSAGIRNDGEAMVIERSTIRGNHSAVSSSAIYSRAPLEVVNSAISGNEVPPRGSAITILSSNAEFTNTTISGNPSGPALEAVTGGSIQLLNVTIAANPAGGLRTFAESGEVTLTNTLLAYNGGLNCQGPHIVSAGHNLDSEDLCALSGEGDVSVVDPLMTSLADNGGSTQTHALLEGSAAIDGAGPECPGTDQRGVTRPQMTACDIGAFEYEPAFEVPPPATVIPGLLPSGVLPTVGVPSPIPPPLPVSAPRAQLAQNGNCHTGPALAYPVVTSLLKGTSVPLEGRNSDHTWWWALIPSGGHCWLAGSVLSLSGDVLGLPIIAALPLEPTATNTVAPSKPAAPQNLAITAKVCDSSKYSVTLGWADMANNETGYRVYRDGTLIATLGAGATSYTDNPPGSGPYVYGVEAYNDAGASSRPTVNESGCVI